MRSPMLFAMACQGADTRPDCAETRGNNADAEGEGPADDAEGARDAEEAKQRHVEHLRQKKLSDEHRVRTLWTTCSCQTHNSQ